MVFFTDCVVAAVLAQSLITYKLLHCVQARLALGKKSSTGGMLYAV